MKKSLLFFIPLLLFFAFGALAQSEGASAGRKSGGFTSNPTFSFELYWGASASLAYGEFINYHKSFHDVAEEGTVFNGAILPVVWGTAGVQARVTPFSFSRGQLNNLGVFMGLQYVQQGFVNQFKMTHTSPLNYTDVSNFRETYRHNYLAIPIQIRWGQRWFGTLGVTAFRHIGSNKTQSLRREVSGSGAYGGGFDSASREKKTLEKELVQKSRTYFSLGGGVQISDRLALAMRANVGGDLLNEFLSRNYRAILFELSFFHALSL
jgi:hypothetical protein